jgi:penicillin-insensitive murein endopeptidase
MERRLLLLALFAFLLTSCARNGFQEPFASVKDAPATTTYSPPTPTKKLIGNKQIVDGVSQVSDLKLNIDGPKATSTLKGTVTFQPVSGAPLSVPFDVSGTISSDDYTSFMRAINQAQMDAMGLQVGAKLTCLYTDCSESFIDIYISYRGIVYHHQVEAKGNEVPQSVVETPKKENPSKDSHDKDASPKEELNVTPKTPKAPLGEVTGDADDGSQFEHDDMDDDSEAGAYVGEPQKDLKVLFPDVTAKNDSADTKKDDKKTDKDKGSKPDEKRPSPPPTKNPEGSSVVKAVLKGLGQAVTALGRNNYVRGHLENAANILSYEESNPNAGFRIVYPKRQSYYGTDDMLAVMAYLGQYSQTQVKGYVLSVGDISAKKGGQLGRHSSHQMGVDADISYYFDTKEKQKGLVDAVASSKPVGSFMANEQWTMFKDLVGQGNVDRIFVHPAIKKELCGVALKKGDLKPSETAGVAFEALRVMRPEVNHDDHFHLRLKCSTAQPRCRQMAPPAKVTGC